VIEAIVELAICVDDSDAAEVSVLAIPRLP
jgi:hypothetical protein